MPIYSNAHFYYYEIDELANHLRPLMDALGQDKQLEANQIQARMPAHAQIHSADLTGNLIDSLGNIHIRHHRLCPVAGWPQTNWKVALTMLCFALRHRAGPLDFLSEHLVELNLSKNRLQSLGGGLNALNSLTSLDLSHNFLDSMVC